MREYKNSHPHGSVGGVLHVVLDDGNWELIFTKLCLESAIEEGDEMGAALCRVLLLMSNTQRKKLAGMFGNI